MKTLNGVDEFTHHYLLAAFWTYDDGAPSGDYETSGRFEDLSERLSAEAIERATKDCMRFQNENQILLARYCEEVDTRGEWTPTSYAGHDFWLTRNSHGAGFWDRTGVEKFTSEALTRAAEKFGECYLYEGDDELFYLS